MARTVLLRHELPDGSFHFDWLLEPGGACGVAAGGTGGAGGSLITFRTMERPDRRGVSALRAQRLADHRAVYLDYEGPVAGGRGSVTRLAAGTCRVRVYGADEFEAEVLWPEVPEQRWRGVWEDGGPGAEGERTWLFTDENIKNGGRV